MIIPVLVKVLDINDNAPKFSNQIYTVQVDELTSVDTTILDQIQAVDLDSANNGLIEYSLVDLNLVNEQAKLSNQQASRLIERAQPEMTTTTTTTRATMTTTSAPPAAVSTTVAANQVNKFETTPISAPTTSNSDNDLLASTTQQSSRNAQQVYTMASSTPTTTTTSKSSPTINLNSEPIINGPMEEGSDEEESDEALLASMNSTDTNNDQDTDSMALMLPGKRRRRRRRSVLSTNNFKRRMFVLNNQNSASTTSEHQMPSSIVTSSLVEKPKDSLWTNLMATSGGDDIMLADKSSQLTTSELIQSINKLESDKESLDFFSLDFAPNSNRPIIKLKKQLDYEKKRIHVLTIMATDKAINKQDRLSSKATILIKVLDGDDQGPAFVLDQGGCATGIVPQTTVSSLSSTSAPLAGLQYENDDKLTNIPLSNRIKRHFVSDKQHQSDDLKDKGTNLPNGFKVSDENFEFSDMNAGSDEADDDQLLRLILQPDSSPLPSSSSSSSASSSSVSQTNRARRFPATLQPPTTMSPIQSLAPNFNMRTTKHYLDYSCLSSSPALLSGQAEYFATVMSGESDYILRIVPQAIKARDRDELNAPIRYSFVNGTPNNYSLYFQINPLDASIKQVAPIEKNNIGRFSIWVQAQEQSQNKLFSLAKLTIDVVPTDNNPPVLVPNSYSGFIEENSLIGTNVMISTQGDNREPMRINVLDVDYGDIPQPSTIVESKYSNDKQHDENSRSNKQSTANTHQYEFETTSDAFKVNKDGYVYISKAFLDRDSPNQATHKFQVTARQIGLISSRSISSPISINVTLLDLNDNPPIIMNSSLIPVQMSADNKPSRIVTTIKAMDKDLPENSKMYFSIIHVSNNGKERFRINQDTGDLEALGKFNSGEQFSLTIQVNDELMRSSQGILEIFVVPGANTGGPQFIIDPEHNGDTSRGGYAVEIIEGIAPHSAVLQLTAKDPENDPISYAIVDGNINNDFYINSKSGIIYVANKLDREEVSAYNLLVQARDSGGLATNRPVAIAISDSNDENPIFNQQPYSFSIEEGIANRILGRVSASDNDSGDNGQISYYLSSTNSNSGKALFNIDEQTGVIKVIQALDYETDKSHILMVTARDHGENPRSTTASVLVRVIDVQDEQPYFERYYIEVKAQEDLPQYKLAQVQAKDPDSVAQITYVLKSGDSNLFQVDPQTGVVSTTRGLDFEEARGYTLLIGTIENQENDLIELSNALISGQLIEKSPICRIDITVNDINDNVPYFINQPLPVRIQDSAQLGTVVTKIQAEDLDGSDPNNLIRYELVTNNDGNNNNNNNNPELSSTVTKTTSEKCANSFMIDSTSGSISVKSDLKRDSQSECQLIIKAQDLGQQPKSLSSTISITIFIDHIAEISPSTMIGFADTSFTVELEENVPSNSLVKMLPVVNKPKINFPMNCEIVSGNEQGKFYVIENESRDCEIKTRDSFIDYEYKQKYILTLRLNTIGGSLKTLAQVNINILDKNDNKPMFNQPSRYGQLTQNKFLAAISNDAPSETQVIQLRATDLDSPHSNGLVSYEILNDNEVEGRFKVDPIDGIIRTSRSVEDIPNTRLPMRLKVMARDNPEIPSNSLDSIAEVMVNLIDDRHRLILVLKDTTTGRVLDNKEELLSTIQERTGLISGLEKIESLKIQRNGTLESDVSGTDFWFYLIEPGTLKIVQSDDIRVRSSLLDQRAQNSLLDILIQTLGFTKAKVRLPYSISSGLLDGRSSNILYYRAFGAGNSFVSILILISLFIAIISAIIIIYQCGSWSSYSKAEKEKLYLQQQQHLQQQNSYYPYSSFGTCPKSQKHSLTLGSQDDYAFRSALSTLTNNQQQQILSRAGKAAYQIDPNMVGTLGKEYETQMLKMSVLFDDNHSLDEQQQNPERLSKEKLNHI